MADEYDRAYQRVKEQLGRAEADAEGFRGACKDCRYFKFKVHEGYSLIGQNYCVNPLIARHEFSIREGKIVAIGEPGPEAFRPSLCGRKGVLFEPALLSENSFPAALIALAVVVLALPVALFVL